MKKNLPPLYGAAAFLMLSAFCAHTQAQTLTVSGTVTHNGQPLSGVTVSQEGSTQATATNSSGRYQLTVTGAVPGLIFRHPKHPLWREEVAGRTVVDVELGGKVQQIQEVTLNAGYYTVKDKERTGSIAKVTAKDIENQPVTNVLSAIQGRVAGVNIVQNGGVVGGGYQIEIRGRNSLRTAANSTVDGNQPLYVVDGMVMGGEISTRYAGTVLPLGSISPLNSINPNDIESVEILKDADATAIYGSRGANGVILITTKKGKAGSLNLSFTANYGMSRIINNLELMNTEQYLNVRRQAFANSGVVNYPATAYDVNGTWDPQRNTNWPNELIGNTATFNEIRASLSGGSEQTKFVVSAGHREQGTPFGQGFRYVSQTLSNNMSHRSKDRRLELGVSNSFSLLKNNVVNTDVTQQAFLLAPNAPELYTADGALNWAGGTFSNPAGAYKSAYTNDTGQLITNLTSAYRILENIRIKVNGGINYRTFEEWSLQPNTMYNPTSALGLSSATSRSGKNNQEHFSFMLEPQLSWDFRLGNHEVSTLVGSALQQDKSSSSYLSGTGYESNAFISNIAAAKTKTLGDQLTSEYRYAAVYGRLNWQYAGKYILNLTGRRDGSSRFGPNNRYANFGAAGAAWIFTKENRVGDLTWLSFGKLRGSYGLAGSDNIGDYQYNDTYTVSPLIYNGVTGLVPSRLFNPDYSWEKTRKLEATVELGFFRNRLNLTASWYRNRSSSQLVGYQLPAVAGFTSVLANLDAEVENKGTELEIHARPLGNRPLLWETSFNVSFPKNKLLSFPGLEGSTYSNSYVIGMPVNIIKLYHLQGIDPATGKYLFTDYNGDGKISAPDDNKVVEQLGVRYFGGWSNRIGYRNLHFSFLVQFVKQRSRNYNSAIPSPGSMSNLPVEALNVWSAENPDGLYMPYQSAFNPLHTYFQSSSATVSDASFIRLKNVQLDYTMPVNSSLFSSARVYVQGQNLITHTRYFGYDPENPMVSFLPPLKTWSFGTQINF